MRRRLLASLSLISLLLFLAAAGLWLSALRREMFFGHTSMPGSGSEWQWHNWSLWSRDAGLYFRSDRYEVGNPRFAAQWDQKPGQWHYKIQPLGTAGPPMGYPTNLKPFVSSLTSGPRRGWAQVRSRHFVAGYLPYWCILALTWPLPAIFAIRWRRRRRRISQHLCLHCGYSLTGNTSGTCSECGTPIQQSAPRTVAQIGERGGG